MTFGWRTFFKILISRVIRSMSFFSLMRAFSRILIATFANVSNEEGTYEFLGQHVRRELYFSERALAQILSEDVRAQLRPRGVRVNRGFRIAAGCRGPRRIILVDCGGGWR